MRVPSGASHGPEPCDFDEAELREYVRLPAGVEYSVMPFWYRPSTYIRFRTTSRAGFTAVELSATALAPPSVTAFVARFTTSGPALVFMSAKAYAYPRPSRITSPPS